MKILCQMYKEQYLFSICKHINMQSKAPLFVTADLSHKTQKSSQLTNTQMCPCLQKIEILL